MRTRFFQAMAMGLAIATGILVRVAGQAPPAATMPRTGTVEGPAVRTAWGEPDLQGIWTQEHQVPLQRPAKYADREFFTEAEIADLDRKRAAALRPGDRVAERGTVQDLGGAYNDVFRSLRPTGRRTSLVVDPPDGRLPSLTAAAKKHRDDMITFENALLQATDMCKNKLPECGGGTYGPPSPKRGEAAPYYVAVSARNSGSGGAINRADGPEDRSLEERCMTAGLPELGGFRRIVQSPRAMSIYYDVGQGQGWQRAIPITDGPHLPAHIRQWWGDSRGRWEGSTLVVDVTNFNQKRDFRGAREKLHLIERYARLDEKTLQYEVTVEDATTWTRPWTVRQELQRQGEAANRIYYEPRCHEGNYGLAGQLVGARADERAFSEGRGPDPATICFGNCGNGITEANNEDPLR